MTSRSRHAIEKPVLEPTVTRVRALTRSLRPLHALLFAIRSLASAQTNATLAPPLRRPVGIRFCVLVAILTVSLLHVGLHLGGVLELAQLHPGQCFQMVGIAAERVVTLSANQHSVGNRANKQHVGDSLASGSAGSAGVERIRSVHPGNHVAGIAWARDIERPGPVPTVRGGVHFDTRQKPRSDSLGAFLQKLFSRRPRGRQGLGLWSLQVTHSDSMAGQYLGDPLMGHAFLFSDAAERGSG